MNNIFRLCDDGGGGSPSEMKEFRATNNKVATRQCYYYYYDSCVGNLCEGGRAGGHLEYNTYTKIHIQVGKHLRPVRSAFAHILIL